MTSGTAWGAPELPAGMPPGNEPALAVIGSAPHLVFTSDGVLYHCSRQADARWTAPVQIAMGGAPALAAADDGTLHCLFGNNFAGNDEIYHIVWRGGAWTLPQNVSHTAGASTQPCLALASDGSPHAVWTDTTPGNPVVYYGRAEQGVWSSVPVPNGRGSNPALAVAADGTLYVAWQDDSAEGGVFDIFCARYQAGAWQLPDNVSASPTGPSLHPTLAVDGQATAHLAWQEQQGDVYQVFYSRCLPGGWTPPGNVSNSSLDCRLPRAACSRQNLTELVWSEASLLRHSTCLPQQPAEPAGWLPPGTAASDAAGLAALSLAVGQNGEAHLAWTAVDGSTCRVFYAQHEPLFDQHIYLPIA